MPTMEQVAEDISAEQRGEFVARMQVDAGLKTWGTGEEQPRLCPERGSTIRRR